MGKSAGERELTACRNANRLGMLQRAGAKKGGKAWSLKNRLGPERGWSAATVTAYIRGLDGCAPFPPARRMAKCK